MILSDEYLIGLFWKCKSVGATLLEIANAVQIGYFALRDWLDTYDFFNIDREQFYKGCQDILVKKRLENSFTY